jgi:hypothetical protein
VTAGSSGARFWTVGRAGFALGARQERDAGGETVNNNKRSALADDFRTFQLCQPVIAPRNPVGRIHVRHAGH